MCGWQVVSRCADGVCSLCLVFGNACRDGLEDVDVDLKSLNPKPYL